MYPCCVMLCSVSRQEFETFLRELGHDVSAAELRIYSKQTPVPAHEQSG
jgi:hypothetical protein